MSNVVNNMVKKAKEDKEFIDAMKYGAGNEVLDKWIYLMCEIEKAVIAATYYGYLVGKYGAVKADAVKYAGI